jgi:hypothetical protein
VGARYVCVLVCIAAVVVAMLVEVVGPFSHLGLQCLGVLSWGVGVGISMPRWAWGARGVQYVRGRGCWWDCCKW